MEEKSKSGVSVLLVVIFGLAGWFLGGVVGDRVLKNYSKPAAHLGMSNDVASFIERTVIVFVPDGHGTGVRISPNGHILTCAHVLDAKHPDLVAIISSTGAIHIARVLCVDSLRDLALLKTQERDTPFATIATAEPCIGTHIWLVGAPMDMALCVYDGRVCRSAVPRTVSRALQISAVINPGASGGPVFTDDGTVVGLAEEVYRGDGRNDGYGTPIGFAVDRQLIKEFLERFKGLKGE